LQGQGGACAVVLPLRQVLVWGRDLNKAEKIAAGFRRGAFRGAATDDLEGAVAGAGDLVQPLAAGDQITLFKSVGVAAQDLAAAGLAAEMAAHNQPFADCAPAVSPC
jgi:ornithine cyclodeaminase/alanine dehydrogenase-like protein (mu-crystallin family)